MNGPVMPPLFDEAPQRLCTRWLGETNCGAIPVMHVLWDAVSLENGMVCAEHVHELGSRWLFAQAHELGPDCGMPGCCWHFDDNVCRCDGEFETAEGVAAEMASPGTSEPLAATPSSDSAGGRCRETTP